MNRNDFFGLFLFSDRDCHVATSDHRSPPSDPQKTRNIFATSLELAEYSLLLQIILRVITFALNGLAFRYLDVGLMGIVNFRIALYYSTLVFAARESFRRACLSRGGEILIDPRFDRHRSVGQDRMKLWHGLLNVMWLT